METINSQGSNNGKFNLWLCINYRKLNSHIQTACQIKADGSLWLYINYRKLKSHIQTTYQIKGDGSLGKVISNYPLPTIDSILAHFNSCKYVSTINLRSGYYHIK